ncbi:MAG: oligosaccharide flippase family protein [Steroidobacteraceae bacterium]
MSRLTAILNQKLAALRGAQLAGNALALYSVQGLNYLMPLLLLPFLLRALQPAGYGAIMFAQALIGYAVIVVEFGFNFTAAREISVARHDPVEVVRIFWTTTFAKVLLLVLAVLLVTVVVALVPSFRQNWTLFAASGLLLIGNVIFPQWYLQGLERLKEVAMLQAVAKCIVTLAAILFVRSAEDLLLAAIILASPQVIGSIVGYCLGKPVSPREFYKPNFAEVIAVLRNSKDLFIANIATTLYLHTNTLLLGLMVSEGAVAMYSVASRIVSTIQGLASPAIQAVFPRASQLFVNDQAEAWQLCKQLAWVMVPSMAVVGFVLLLFAPQLMALLGGAQYESAIAVLRIMAFVPMLVCTAMLLSQLIMVNIGLGAQLSRLYLKIGLLNLIVLPLLVTLLEERGAAISLVIAELLGPILMLSVIRNSSATSVLVRVK